MNAALPRPHTDSTEAARPARYDPPTEPRRKRFSLAEFERLARDGVLEGRVELWDGEIIEMPPTGNAHSVCRSRLNRLFALAWPPPRFVRAQDTHRFDGGWAPEPDLALLDQEPVDGATVDPLPRLVVEIMQSSADRDLGEKRLRYARAGVPEYWVADLTRRVVHVFRNPDPTANDADAAWRDLAIAKPDDTVSPLCIPDLTLTPAEFMPAAGAGPER